MKLNPHYDSYSSFFNVSLYLDIPFGLELSSSFQNLLVSERVNELKKLLNLLKRCVTPPI